MLAAALAMVVTIAVGHPLLAALRQRKLGKAYSGDEPEAYATKAGTPTMGGIIFLIGITVAVIPFAILRDADVLIPFLAMLAGGALGTYDDLQTLSGSEKLSGHETWFFFVKWAVLLGIGAVVAAELFFRLSLSLREFAQRRSACRSIIVRELCHWLLVMKECGGGGLIMPKKEIITVGKIAAINPNLSLATRFGDLVFVAGQTGRHPVTGELGKDVREQTNLSLLAILSS